MELSPQFVSNFLTDLGIKNDQKTIHKLLYHAIWNDPLKDLSDLLEDFNVDSLIINVTFKKFQQIELPLFAQISYPERGNEIILINQQDGNKVYYIDQSGRKKTMSLENLEIMWQGYVMVIDNSKIRAKQMFRKSKQMLEYFSGWKFPSLVFFIGSLIILLIGLKSYFIIGLYLINSFGLLLSLKVYGLVQFKNSKMLDSVFYNSEIINRSLTLKAIKIGNNKSISFSGMLMNYFLFNIIYMLVSSILRTCDITPLYISSIFGFGCCLYIPIKLWKESIHCKTCLFAVYIIITQLIFMYSFQFAIQFQWKSILIIAFALVCTYSAFYLLSKFFIVLEEQSHYRKSFYRLLNDTRLINSLIQNGRKASTFPPWIDLELANKQALNQIIVIYNPTDPLSFAEYLVTKKLISNLGNEISVVLIPFKPKNESLYLTRIGPSIIRQFSLTKNQSDRLNLIEETFRNQYLPYKKKLAQLADINIDVQSMEIYSQLVEWVDSNLILHTPTYILNGVILDPTTRIIQIKKYLNENLI